MLAVDSTSKSTYGKTLADIHCDVCVSGMDIDASKAWETYSLRDEQEKYFSDMKGTMLDDRNPAWSEKGKEGRIL